MYNRHNLPSWRTLAVRHSGVRTKRQLERRPWKEPWRKDEVYRNCFYSGERSWRNGAPRTKGRRLHLEDIGDK